MLGDWMAVQHRLAGWSRQLDDRNRLAASNGTVTGDSDWKI